MPFAKLIKILRVDETLIIDKLVSRISQSSQAGLEGVLAEDEWRIAVRTCAQALSDYLEAHNQPDLLNAESPAGDLPKTLGIREADRCTRHGVKLNLFMGFLKALRSALFELIDESIHRSAQAYSAKSLTGHFLDEMELSFCSRWAAPNKTATRAEPPIDVPNLMEERSLYRAIFHSIADPAFVVNQEMVIMEVNKSFQRFFGAPRHEALGGKCHEVLACGVCGNCPLEACATEKSSFSDFVTVLAVDGSPKTVSVSGYAAMDEGGDYVGTLIIVRDLTDRKQMENALLESEEKYRSLYSSMTEGVALHEILYNAEGDASDYTILDVNPAFEAIIGLKRDDVLGRKASEVYGTGRPPHLQTCARVAETSQSTAFRTYYSRLKKHLAVAVFSPGPGRFATVFEDITERQRAEEQCARLATAVEQASELIIVTDTSGIIQYVNPAFEKNTGYTREEVLGRTPSILRSGRHDREFYEELWDTIGKGRVWRGHFINKRKDGTLFEEEATITPMRDTLGNITNYVAVKRDVTNEKELERRLIQAHKMEAIGTLAGGIAHDFNNILAAILGYTEMTLNKVTANSVAHDNLEQVVQAARRARELVQQILLFSRRGAQERRPARLDLIIGEALKLLRASLPSTIEIRHNIPSDHTPLIHADSTQIHQVLMNLCSNAAHAMREKGGILTITLEEVNLESTGKLLYPQLDAGRYLKLTVSDTGHGMSHSTIERIFDPFFTTKKSGEGTGMGLAVVHGIVESHGGAIGVESEPGQGSSFQIYFPEIEPTVGATSEVLASVPKGKGRILFVDDEEALVNLAKQMLGALGYDVTAEVSSVRALDLFRAHPEHFDLLVTDYTMPLMTGIDLALEAMRIRPDIPVVLCTGFSDMIDAEKAKAKGIREFIMKPLTLGEAARAIAAVMDNQDVPLQPPRGKEVHT